MSGWLRVWCVTTAFLLLFLADARKTKTDLWVWKRALSCIDYRAIVALAIGLVALAVLY